MRRTPAESKSNRSCNRRMSRRRSRSAAGISGVARGWTICSAFAARRRTRGDGSSRILSGPSGGRKFLLRGLYRQLMCARAGVLLNRPRSLSLVLSADHRSGRYLATDCSSSSSSSSHVTASVAGVLSSCGAATQWTSTHSTMRYPTNVSNMRSRAESD